MTTTLSTPAEMQVLDAAIVDAEIAAPAGLPCPACGTPVELHEKFCPACGATNAAAASSGAKQPEPADSPLTRHLQCKSCGAQIATDLTQRSFVCPFCDSTVVVEYAPDLTGRQPPEFVIGFTVTPEQAQARFKAWLRENHWFRPGDLSTASVADKMRGIYLPFWSFSMLIQSQWQAQIGEYWYRTETYTTTDSKGRVTTHTRQVRETEWWPLAGRHHRYYSGYLVSGSRGLPQGEALRIQPFQLPALRRYEAWYLAGWLAEEYSIVREEAQTLCQQEFQRQENANVAAFLPGDTHSGVAVQSQCSQINSDLCLLPIYIVSYRYREKLYRFLLNGQTGKMAGDKPVSTTRIAVAVAVVLFLLAVIALIIFALSNSS